MAKQEEFIELKSDVKYIRRTLDEMKEEVKENTIFRNKANGIIGFFGIIAGLLGGLMVWVFGKIWGK